LNQRIRFWFLWVGVLFGLAPAVEAPPVEVLKERVLELHPTTRIALPQPFGENPRPASGAHSLSDPVAQGVLFAASGRGRLAKFVAMRVVRL
jgi:hypothetical protein